MISFKSPQLSPMGMLLSFARALGIVSSVDDVVIVPLSPWHAMESQKERADQNERDRRDAVARALVAEAAQHALEKIVVRQTARADAACRTIEHRDQRIKELNAWLDSHVPMVQR